MFCSETTATLCSALATLPNLKSAVLLHQRLGREDVPTFQSPESMTEFLRTPSLRMNRGIAILLFHELTLRSNCDGIETRIVNHFSCSLPMLLSRGRKIASALKENATLTTFEISPVPDSIHQAFYDAMAASLLTNSMLQDLVINDEQGRYSTSVCVSSLLLALGINKTLRKLHVSGFSSVGGSVIPALREGLGINSTLEILELFQGGFLDVAHVTEASFRIAVLEALQLNKTLKTLRLGYDTPKLTDDEVNHLNSVVKKNYGLESLPALALDVRMETCAPSCD
jgi:hypothetical protein